VGPVGLRLTADQDPHGNNSQVHVRHVDHRESTFSDLFHQSNCADQQSFHHHSHSVDRVDGNQQNVLDQRESVGHSKNADQAYSELRDDWSLDHFELIRQSGTVDQASFQQQVDLCLTDCSTTSLFKLLNGLLLLRGICAFLCSMPDSLSVICHICALCLNHLTDLDTNLEAHDSL